MIPEEDIEKLRELVERLEKTPPLLELAIFEKERATKVNFLKHTDKEIEEISRRKVPTAPIARKGFDPERGNLNHNLGYHVQITALQFDDWFAWALFPPPYSSRRILAITKRAKLFDLRSRFERTLHVHWAALRKPPVVHTPSGSDEVDYLQRRIPRLKVSVKSHRPLDSGGTHIDVEFHCVDCGGYIINAPEDDEPSGPVICKACQQVFGSWQDVKSLGQAMANHYALVNDLPSVPQA